MGVQQMGKDNGGRGGIIVNVASVLGLEAFPQLPIYSATNHAVIAFSRSYSVIFSVNIYMQDFFFLIIYKKYFYNLL